MNRSTVFLICLVIILWFPSSASCLVLKSDTVWSGEVLLTEDIVVPEGVVLTVMPGAVVRVSFSESTKTDPEYISSLTEITVRGSLRAEGREDSPVLFKAEGGRFGGWAGVIVDGGTVVMDFCTIRDADTGLNVFKGAVTIKNSSVVKNRYGFSVEGPDPRIGLSNVRVKENDYGFFLMRGAKITSESTTISGNRKKDICELGTGYKGMALKEYRADNRDRSRVYGDEVLLGDTIWQGRIEVSGLVRVPGGGRLIIVPGTVIEFRKKDENKDGIGESGLLVQGVLIAKGTPESPVIFRSAERPNRMGDWDAINIMNSDGARNLIEYCQIEDSYRGLHFHFSSVSLKGSVLRNNYRGIQFQESEADITGNYIYGNKSGLQARDSEISLNDNYVLNNYSGANLLRTNVMVKGNTVMNNVREGLRVREGIPVVEENLIDGNRFGLMVADSVYGNFSGNVITGNMEAGILLKGTDNIELSRNFIQGSGLNGISVQDSRAVIKGNLISGNGERGIGIISFDGLITENNIMKNGLYAVDLEGKMNVSAPMNWWGGGPADKVVFDGGDDPQRGRVDYQKTMEAPVPVPWPLREAVSDVTWHGEIHVPGIVKVLPGAILTVEPDTRVVFSEGAGLRISGRIKADGLDGARIVFTSLKKKGDSEWDEILLEYAAGSSFSNCDFEYATWGIHSHFTDLLVTGCSFRKNYGGMRFRSGPAEIRNSRFENNKIGIRAYRGNAAIAGNIITENETGIFVREKGGGLRINGNNLFANSGYNIRIGDFNEEDVDAKDNWWGGTEPASTIFDGRNEPGIGKVNYEPYAGERIKTAYSRDRLTPGGGSK